MPTCHHAAIYHRGPLSGIAVSNTHLPSVTHIPPGPFERALSNVGISSCTHIPLGNAHLPSCTHIPPGPSAAIIRPYTTGALLTVFCPKLTYHHAPPYHRGLSGIALSHPTCHHADIYHRGLLSGSALPSAHLPFCTHIPPGPLSGALSNTHMVSYTHIPPGLVSGSLSKAHMP